LRRHRIGKNYGCHIHGYHIRHIRKCDHYSGDIRIRGYYFCDCAADNATDVMQHISQFRIHHMAYLH